MRIVINKGRKAKSAAKERVGGSTRRDRAARFDLRMVTQSYTCWNDAQIGPELPLY
jgi:hypothetical protein